MVDNVADILTELNSIKQVQERILNKLELLTSVNTDLINANMKLLSSSRNDIQKQQSSSDSETDDTSDKLIYEICSDSLYVSGSTYSNKDKIKGLGGRWDPGSSKWKINNIQENKFLETFPRAKKRNVKCLLDEE